MSTTTDTLADTAEALATFAIVVFEQDDIVEIRRIRGEQIKSTWHTAAELPDMADDLLRDNADGWNIYAGVNPRERHGARKDESVKSARAIFADFDNTEAAEARGRWEAAGMPAPSIIIASGHGIHVYWRLTSPTAEMSAWRELQADLAAALGSDPKVKNPERTMRLPGFQNVKAEPVPCSVIESDATRRIEWDTIREIIPKPTPPPPPKIQNTNAGNVGDKLKRCMAYLARMPSAVSGQGGHDVTLQAACECFRFGLSSNEAAAAMSWFNSTKCEPAWSEREIQHKLNSAEDLVSRAGEVGARLTERRDNSGGNGKAARNNDELSPPTGTGFDEWEAGHPEPPEFPPPLEQRPHYEMTDVGNGKRYAAENGDSARRVAEWNKAIIFTGRHWKVAQTGEEFRLGNKTIRGMRTEAAEGREDDKAGAEKLWKHAAKTESQQRRRAMVECAWTEMGMTITADKLDTDPWAFNVLNGTIDLQAGGIRPHERADLITKLAHVRYDPTATAPKFIAFLDRTFQGNTDLIEFIQRFTGYCMTGKTGERVVVFFYGIGANGKSTLLGILRELFGDYAATADTSLFMANASENAIGQGIARLKGARLVSAIEAEEGRRLSEGLVKAISGGGGEVVGRYLYGEPFSFKPTFKVVIATNHKPTIRGTDTAIWSRIRLVPFLTVIPEAERDQDLLDKLRAELPGILNWAIEGAMRWQVDGLGTPKQVAEATKNYREEQDALAGFIDDCCEVGEGENFVAGATALYQRYRAWAGANGEHEISQTRFGGKLSERLFVSIRSKINGRKVWAGIRLMNDELNGSNDAPEQSEP